MIVLLFAALIVVVGVLAVLFAGLASAGTPPVKAGGAAGPTGLAAVPWRPGNDPAAPHMLVVGRDIEPGTYTARGGYADPNHMCTWARVRGFSGQRDGVIQSGTSAGPVTVTIEATDKGFVTGWCGEWASGRPR